MKQEVQEEPTRIRLFSETALHRQDLRKFMNFFAHEQAYHAF